MDSASTGAQLKAYFQQQCSSPLAQEVARKWNPQLSKAMLEISLRKGAATPFEVYAKEMQLTIFEKGFVETEVELAADLRAASEKAQGQLLQ